MIDNRQFLGYPRTIKGRSAARPLTRSASPVVVTVFSETFSPPDETVEILFTGRDRVIPSKKLSCSLPPALLSKLSTIVNH